MKNGVKVIRKPSAIAKLRMRRVVTDCFRARAVMLQMTNKFPGQPRRKMRLRMKAPIDVATGLSTMVSFPPVVFIKFEQSLWAIFVCCQRE